MYLLPIFYPFFSPYAQIASCSDLKRTTPSPVHLPSLLSPIITDSGRTEYPWKKLEMSLSLTSKGNPLSLSITLSESQNTKFSQGVDS